MDIKENTRSKLPKPVDKDLKRKYQVGLYLTKDELNKIDEMAEFSKLTRNAYIRMVLFNPLISQMINNQNLGKDYGRSEK